MVKETDKPLLGTFLRDVEDGLCQFPVIGIHKADHLGKGFKTSKTVVPGPHHVFALLLKIIEKGEDELRG